VTTIALSAVSRWYGSVLGVNNVELTIGPGVTGLLGPNGAGKSTLMKLLYGELRPSHGEVRVYGERPFANPEVARRIGIVPEGDSFYPRVSGRDFVRFLMRLHGLDEAASIEATSRALKRVGLEEAAGRAITTYSKGMRQRLKLAQAIAHGPDLLILDEPLAALDPVGRYDVMELIRAEGARGATVVVSSHILHEVELMTREVVLMSQGRVLATGNVHEIRGLIDAHPHRVRVSTSTPRALAARLLEFSGIKSVSFSEERKEVLAETSDPEHFYRGLAELVLDQGMDVSELDSPDDNLESVFHYLVGT